MSVCRRLGVISRGIPLRRPLRPLYTTTIRSYATVKTPNIDWEPVKSGKDLNEDEHTSFAHKAVFGLLCVAPFLTFALGVWQVKRLKWKTKLINEAEDSLTYPSMPLPTNLSDEELTKGMKYHKVYATGEFDYSREVFVGPRLREGRKGYMVVCPMRMADGSGEVLVERGWVSEDKVIPERRRLQHLSCPQGVITVECVIKDPPRKGSLQMDHKSGQRLFEFLDADAMWDQCGTRRVYLQSVETYHDRPEWKRVEEKVEEKGEKSGLSQWFSFGAKSTQPQETSPKQIQSAQIERLKQDAFGSDATEFDPYQFMDAGVPIGQEPRVEYRNNHLQYLVTWFCLSLASAILLGMTIKKGKWVNPKDEKIKHARKFLG